MRLGWGSCLLLYLGCALVHLSLESSLNGHDIPRDPDDDSVCFDNCNEHGVCRDYECFCYPGYHGDACQHSFVDGMDEVYPILTQGHYNLTAKALAKAIKKEKFLVVGFSSQSCYKCIQAEPEYKALSDELLEMKVPFARVDADGARSALAALGEKQLPVLAVYQNRRAYVYEGPHKKEWVLEYLDKLRAPRPYADLPAEAAAVEGFLRSPARRPEVREHLAASAVVGFFSDPDGIEEDEMEEFLEAAQHLQTKADVYFARVTDEDLIEKYKDLDWIDRTPSVLVVRAGDFDESGRTSTNLDELYGEAETESLEKWILQASIPLVGELTGKNFGVYEKLGKPIFMMFLNLQGTVVNPLADYVPGKTGSLSNNELVMELREAAKDHFGRISFVYIDGIEHADRMKALGLYGGQERLPALALNTKDGKKLPFPEVLPINRDTILQFCADYLSGRMNNEDDAQEMAKKALMATNFNRKNQAQRQERKKPPEEKTGISEQWKKKDPVVQITSDNFEEIVLDEDRDVVVLFTSKECESCSHMTPYYKRLGRRFAELEQEEGGLGGGNVTVGVMDLADDTPPLRYATVLVADLPLVVLFPARDKGAPFRYYSGVSKVRPMMEWVAQHSGSGVVLPRLPHLNEEDRQLFKEQVREREEYKAKKKAEEEAAMEEEQRRLEEFRQQKKKARVEEEEENPHHHEEEGQGEEKHHNKVDGTIFSANSGGQEHDDDDGDIPTVASLDDNNEDGDGYSDYYEYDEL